ncbi:MAG: hypothetical protein A3F72_10785 [Bacteroidetes bacterium RIFCSPLOWO2_12_FULL_35_15]|nr:MAG: hypothetical protein A3F72_10785 [Bacteroidetes bacterium RIFCSPLOWO2_12_FULL_35_15]
MQKIDLHISNLLYDHDCVIVPELGGFVANYTCAKIHSSQHSFIPPSKNIVFNKNLKNNDGLLANQISSAESINYSSALQHISAFVNDSNLLLKKGGKVKIADVGTLFLDVEKNVQFEADTTNFLIDAFGLSQFQSPAIKRDNIGKRIEKEFKDRGAVPAEKRKINIKRYVALALVAPLIFGIIWIPLKTDLLKNINYSNLNPFASKEIAKPEIKIEAKKSNAKTILINSSDTSAIKPIITQSLPVTANLVEPVIADTTSVAKQISNNVDLKFHLVTGCFQIQENAEKFVIDLQSQHISASIIGQNDRGLYVVSCGDYASRKEANSELINLRKLQPYAWLFKK